MTGQGRGRDCRLTLRAGVPTHVHRLRSEGIATAVAALILIACSFPAVALADGATPTLPSTVAGTVTNHTTGAHAVGQVGVTLRVYQNQQLQNTIQGRTDATGQYAFTGLSADPAFQYLPVVSYEGVSYSGDAVRLVDAKSDPLHDDVAIFETTTQDPGLRYENATLVLGSVEQATQHLSFLELLTLTNPSDRTYVPPSATQGMATGLLRFSLPPGVDDIGVQNGLDTNQLLEVDSGLASTLPVAPGLHTVSFSFAVPYHGSTFDFAWNVIYPAAAVNVLEPVGGPALTAGTLAAAPNLALQGHTFRVLSGGGIGANTTVAIVVRGLPGRTPIQALQAALPNGKVVPVTALVLAVLAALSPVVYLRRRHGRGKMALVPTAESLLDALASLDDAHERGEVAEADYAERRAALKARLERSMPHLP